VKKVSIITDSTSCLPKELAEENGICVVPLNIVYGGESYRDGVDISPSEVYRIMISPPPPPPQPEASSIHSDSSAKKRKVYYASQ
jgi:fatty acid-binding protein DegV